MRFRHDVPVIYVRSYLALWAAGVLAALEIAWYGLNTGGRWGPAALGWAPSALIMAIGAGMAYWAARAPALAPAARRFWRQISVSGAICVVSLLVAIGYSARSGSPRVAGVPPLPCVVLSGLAVVLAVRALLQVPVGQRGRAQWTRLLLDLGIVGLGAALIMWYATIGPMLLGSTGVPLGGAALWGALAVGVLCLAAVTAIAKIMLAGAGPVDTHALLLLGGGLLGGGISAGTVSVVISGSQAVPGQLVIPFVGVMFTLAGRRQRRVADAGPEAGPDAAAQAQPMSERAFSLLPYGAVAATDVLLVLAVRGSTDVRGAVVVGGVIAITAVVGVRQFVAFVDNARMVRALRDQEELLRHQAAHDALTHLANRTLFTERLDAALSAATSPAEAGEVAVLLVDLDDFKTVNDTLGHPVGDTLLRSVADRLRNCIHVTDTVARLGGDEFGVLLHGVEPETAESTAERILASLTSPIVAGDHRLLIRASIGVAIAGPGDDSGVALRNADIAMYAAKERGKGGFARYVPGMATNVLEHARLGAQLREAIANGQLSPYFQPIVHLTSRQVVGVETLVRWQHPTRGILAPNEFIRTAERTGLIVPMGRWILREACRQYAQWRSELGAAAPETVAVNVSSRQLAEPGFPAEVAAAVHDAGLEPSQVVLEMTEDAVLTGGQAMDALRALSDLGVRIALDDFGTGQSSLGLLRTCPVRILKLDKSFVDGIANGTHQAAIATAVVRMAQALGLEAIAEGVESERQVEFLLGLGYRLGQGFHLGCPLPAGDVVRHFGEPDPALAAVR